MFRKTIEFIKWSFDWYARLELLGKIICAVGFGASAMTAIAAFLATVHRGIDPLIAIFLGLLALLLCALLTLIVIQIQRKRFAGAARSKSPIAPAIELHGQEEGNEWDVALSGHGPLLHTGETHKAKDSKYKIRRAAEDGEE
ncbi:MAG TPA: hypothetical protein VIJ62_02195 [Rhizomicrobium sp.]